MKYISVTSPGSDMSVPIFNYFRDYLVSLGEPTTSPGWTRESLKRHFIKMLHEKPEGIELYVDSGGFQIIVDFITVDKIDKYVDIYHELCNELCDGIDNIFSLDIFNRNLSGQQLYDFNNYSIKKSIELIQQKPQFADKQLFVLQSSNRYSFGNWKKLMDELEVNKFYKKWAIGGLVGLKKTTNAKFSHAIPATLWLLTYQKSRGMIIDQVHWLGQSSRLSFISMALMERLYKINMTSDSSQLVRFAALEQKFPFMFQNLFTKEFMLVNSVNDVFDKMLRQHSMGVNHRHAIEVKNDESDKSKPEFNYYTPKEYFDNYSLISGIKNAKPQLHNVDFIECQSQNVYFDMQFAEIIADEIISIGIDNISSSDQLLAIHPIMNQGRIAQELFNNILYFKKFKPIVEAGDLDKANHIMETIHDGYDYYISKRNQTLYDTEINALTQLLDSYTEQLDIAKFRLDTFNNEEFKTKFNYQLSITKTIDVFDKFLNDNLEEQSKIKHQIKVIKSKDQANYDALVNDYKMNNGQIIADIKAKDLPKFIRGILKDKIVTTDIKYLNDNLKALVVNYNYNDNIKKTLPIAQFDEDIFEYNLVQEDIHRLEHEILKLEDKISNLKK